MGVVGRMEDRYRTYGRAHSVGGVELGGRNEIGQRKEAA